MKRLPSLFLLTGFLLIYACANTGSPSGGPKDKTPPKLINSIPLPNQTNYNKQKVEIVFDELVSLKSVSEKVIISPPQRQTPTTKTSGNKILVTFADSMLANTTYTIDFTDAIEDYNENNKFGDYSFSFSTGAEIDTFRVSGTLVDASTLNPVSGVIVGIHENLHDSAFTKTGFRRISKTDKNGFFTVKGVPKRPFRIYALGDNNRDYTFDQHGESIAYYDSIVSPWTEPCQRIDTLWKDSITVDTIINRTIVCYKPDDIVLRYFKEDFGRQYIAKKERPQRNKIGIVFGYKSETLPKLNLLNSTAKDWYQAEINPTKDTLLYWITDTTVSSMDTLSVKIDYLKTDSTDKLVPALDTLSLVYRKDRLKKPDKPKKKIEDSIPAPIIVEHLKYEVGLSSAVDVFAEPKITWDAPIKEIIGEPWHLSVKKETDWKDMPFKVVKDSARLRGYILKADWKFGEEYRFEIDSGMVCDVYGKTNDKYSQVFKIRAEEEYSRLIVNVSGLASNGFAELLDNSDKVVRSVQIVDDVADFKFVMPGTYFLRVIDDLNGNRKWDTGNYEEKRQPENVYYRPEEIVLRANWDVEEDFDVLGIPLLEQKPKALNKKTEKNS